MKLLLLILLSFTALADSRAIYNDSIFNKIPFNFGTSKVTVVTKNDNKKILDFIVSSLRETESEWTKKFGALPRKNFTITLLNKDEYFKKTNAPEWSNAIYENNTIYLMIDNEINFKKIKKTIKHEYTHAILSSLSGGKTPCWLDEGLAQLVEGEPVPELSVIMDNWLKKNKPIKLNKMNLSFTDMTSEQAAVAYAQSLYYTNNIIKKFGYQKLKYFLEQLSQGNDSEIAFEIAFNNKLEKFESESSKKLEIWGLN